MSLEIDGLRSDWYQRCCSDEKQEFTDFIKTNMTLCGNTKGKENKKAIVIEIFEKLSSMEGKRYVYHNQRFKETVRKKLIQFIEEGYDEFRAYYEKLFDKKYID